MPTKGSENLWSYRKTFLEWHIQIPPMGPYWPKCPEASTWKSCLKKNNNLKNVFSLVVAVAPCGSVDVCVEIFCLVFFCVLMVFACCKLYLNVLQHLIISCFDVLHHCKHKAHHSKSRATPPLYENLLLARPMTAGDEIMYTSTLHPGIYYCYIDNWKCANANNYNARPPLPQLFFHTALVLILLPLFFF